MAIYRSRVDATSEGVRPIEMDDERKRELRRLKKEPPCPECGRRLSAADLSDAGQYWEAMRHTPRRYVVAEGTETMLVRVGDKRHARSVFLKGRYDDRMLVRASEIAGLTEGISTVVDVGAGVGLVAVSAVQRNLASTAIAIEPDEWNFRVLQANIALNGVSDQVQAVRSAVGAPGLKGVRLAPTPKNPGDPRSVPKSGSATEPTAPDLVPMSTLDTLAPELKPDSDLVWIDVAGYEGDVLKGASAAVASGVPFVLGFWPRELDTHKGFDAVLSLVAEYGGWHDLSSTEPVRQKSEYLRDLYQSIAEASSSVSTTILVTK